MLVAMTYDNNSSTIALVIVMDHGAIYNSKWLYWFKKTKPNSLNKRWLPDSPATSTKKQIVWKKENYPTILLPVLKKILQLIISSPVFINLALLVENSKWILIYISWNKI